MNFSSEPSSSVCKFLLDRSNLSCRGFEIFPNDARVLRRNSQKSQGRTFGCAASLLPIPKCMNANAHGLSKLSLRQSHEAPECGNVVA